MASNPEQEIRRRIARRGRITCCEFMEIALYWPDGGYYLSHDVIGPGGDFFTAPGAHPAFSALIGLQTFQMWETMGRPCPFWIVEAGAGAGLLCHDLVHFSQGLPEGFGRALRYVCLDLSPTAGLESELPTGMGAKAHRAAASRMPLKDIEGCILSNELLDSFPVHRVTVQNGRLQEIYVTLSDGELAEVAGPPSTPDLERRLQKVGASLEEGWCGEVNLALDGWVAQAAHALERGYLLTIDYGRPAAELYSAQRPRGTLTTFRHHVQTDDPLHHIGGQDISAQVDFTALEMAGAQNGLLTVGTTSQRQFLLNLGMDQWIRGLTQRDMSQAEANANRMGMQQLIRPGGMGDFRVLVQSKGTGCPGLWGLQKSTEVEGLVKSLPMPPLTRLHMPLQQARYPYGYGD